MLARRAAVLSACVVARALSFGTLNSWRGGAVSHASIARGLSMVAPQALDLPITLTSAVLAPSSDGVASWSGDLLVLPFWEVEKEASITLDGDLSALDEATGGALAEFIEFQEFKGSAGSSAVVTLPKGSPARRLALVGLGKADKFSHAGAKKFGKELASLAKAQKAKLMGALMPSPMDVQAQQNAVETALIDLSPDTRFKSDKDADENKPPPLQQLDLLGEPARQRPLLLPGSPCFPTPPSASLADARTAESAAASQSRRAHVPSLTARRP